MQTAHCCDWQCRQRQRQRQRQVYRREGAVGLLVAEHHERDAAPLVRGEVPGHGAAAGERVAVVRHPAAGEGPRRQVELGLGRGISFSSQTAAAIRQETVTAGALEAQGV